jgi:hypothetical protein
VGLDSEMASRCSYRGLEKSPKKFRGKKNYSTFALLKLKSIFVKTTVDKRELSSAGSEHLPYKQRVTGSNPVAPT